MQEETQEELPPSTSRYRREDHAVSLLNAHLVFCTKYRRPVISGRVFEVLRLSMNGTSTKLGVELQAMQSDKDHLHLLIGYTPKLSIGYIAKRLKGASSFAVRAKNFREVSSRLWGRNFWSSSYFAASCGGASLEVVKRYVEEQGR